MATHLTTCECASGACSLHLRSMVLLCIWKSLPAWFCPIHMGSCIQVKDQKMGGRICARRMSRLSLFHSLINSGLLMMFTLWCPGVAQLTDLPLSLLVLSNHTCPTAPVCFCIPYINGREMMASRRWQGEQMMRAQWQGCDNKGMMTRAWQWGHDNKPQWGHDEGSTPHLQAPAYRWFDNCC
jgi:hypothetical protein